MTMTERERVIDECLSELHKQKPNIKWTDLSGFNAAIHLLDDLRATPAAAPDLPTRAEQTTESSSICAPNRSGATTGATEANALEASALRYHMEVEGEYGCPGVSCPGVQRLVKWARSLPSAVFARTGISAPAEGETGGTVQSGTMAWRPIATAPRDVAILLCDGQGAQWINILPDTVGYVNVPTCWMPLPDPPASGSSPRGDGVATSVPNVPDSGQPKWTREQVDKLIQEFLSPGGANASDLVAMLRDYAVLCSHRLQPVAESAKDRPQPIAVTLPEGELRAHQRAQSTSRQGGAMTEREKVIDELVGSCEQLLAFVREKYPHDFMDGGDGYTCAHHRAIAVALSHLRATPAAAPEEWLCLECRTEWGGIAPPRYCPTDANHRVAQIVSSAAQNRSGATTGAAEANALPSGTMEPPRWTREQHAEFATFMDCMLAHIADGPYKDRIRAYAATLPEEGVSHE